MRFEFDQLCQLFGRPVEDDAVQRLLTSMPPYTLDRPSDGAQYLICKSGGIDLLFKDDVNRGSGKKQSRLLKAFYAYNEDADGHARCDIALPFAFSLSDSREDLLAKRLPNSTWDFDAGDVPVKFIYPAFDMWLLDGFEVSAHYYERTTAVHSFQVQPSDPSASRSHVVPETWQSLAIGGERKADAIRMYREENGGTISDAKAAIERYAADNLRQQLR